jgi:hypothetical protein
VEFSLLCTPPRTTSNLVHFLPQPHHGTKISDEEDFVLVVLCQIMFNVNLLCHCFTLHAGFMHLNFFAIHVGRRHFYFIKSKSISTIDYAVRHTAYDYHPIGNNWHCVAASSLAIFSMWLVLLSLCLQNPVCHQ